VNAPFAPPRSRNDPCPCGSGKRYKHCHGSETPPADTYVAPDPALDPLERARAAIRAGRHADAVAILDAAHVEERSDPAALRLLGEALRPIDLARSRACWQRVLDDAPDDPEAHFFVGDLDREGGDIDGAIAHFDLALAHAPDHPAILNNLGLALEKAGRLREAEAKFRRMLELVPDALNALANLAQNLYQQMRHKEAVLLFDKLIERMPAAPAEIWANRGVAQRLCAMLPAAEASLVRATELAPDEPGPWRDLGITRTAQQQWGRAAIALRRAFELHPDDRATETMLLHVYGYEAYWKDFPRLRADVIAAAKDPPAEGGMHTMIVPFAFQSINDDPAIELKVARRWSAQEFLPPVAERPSRRASDGKLRLGFVSADLHGHPVGRLIVGLFERLDRKRFEVFAYSTGMETKDEVRQRITDAVDRFRAYPVIDFFEIADTMRADGIDVAFDLTGFTAGSVLSVLQLRPAPVQVNFLGFTGTLASAAIDWMITDSFCVPPDAAHHIVERPLYIEPCYLPNDAARTFSDDALTRATYKLPDDATVFASMAAAYKIMPEHFDAMLDILLGVPGSVLWLRDQPSTVVRRLELAAQAHGVDAARLIYAPNEKVPRYLKRFALAELFLDTMPFGAHTTVNDALFSGLPVLARAGRSFASRASASQVIAAGLPELAVTSRDDYVKLAIALGNDRPRLAAMAAKLRATRDALPLFDLDRYTRTFEAAIEHAWRETPLD
jgi:predicted O-linked N-acetylglucosamine transferase (SPINDLY family)